MQWHEASAETGRRWEREDANAVVSVRETATGDWGVTYDRLQQAPEGSAFRYRTVTSESAALALAAKWCGADVVTEEGCVTEVDGD